MKKSLEIKAIALVIAFVTIFSIACCVFEANAAGVDPSTINGEGVTTDTSSITSLGNQAVQIISTVGSVAAVIVLIVLGIKYMMGSTEEKAEYKKTLMPYVIGAVLIFAASVIAGAIYGFANNIQI